MENLVLKNILIEDLVDLQKSLGRAQNTLNSMTNAYLRASKYMKLDSDSLKSMTKKDAQKVIVSLSKDYSISTIKQTRVFLNELFEHAELESPFKKVKMPIKKKGDGDKIKFFTREQAESILNKAIGKGSLNDKRNFAMIKLMLNIGLRKSEVLSLNISDLNLEDNTIVLRDTKSEDVVTLNINEGTAMAIREYIELREDSEDALFVSSYKSRMSSSGIDLVISKILKSLNLDGSCHTFRHTVCSLMADANMSLTDIQAMARHSSSATTMRYISQSNDRKKKIVEQFSI